MKLWTRGIVCEVIARGFLHSFSLLSFSDMTDFVRSVGMKSFSFLSFSDMMVDVVGSVKLESFSEVVDVVSMKLESFSGMVDVVSVRLESFSGMVDVVSVKLESFSFFSFSDMMDVVGSVGMESFSFPSFSEMVDVVSVLLSGDGLMKAQLSVDVLCGVGEPGLLEVRVCALFSSGRLAFFSHCRAVRYCFNICDTYGVGQKVGSWMGRLAKL